MTFTQFFRTWRSEKFANCETQPSGAYFSPKSAAELPMEVTESSHDLLSSNQKYLQFPHLSLRVFSSHSEVKQLNIPDQADMIDESTGNINAFAIGQWKIEFQRLFNLWSKKTQLTLCRFFFCCLKQITTNTVRLTPTSRLAKIRATVNDVICDTGLVLSWSILVELERFQLFVNFSVSFVTVSAILTIEGGVKEVEAVWGGLVVLLAGGCIPAEVRRPGLKVGGGVNPKDVLENLWPLGWRMEK
jgi:hypothetical protein